MKTSLFRRFTVLLILALAASFPGRAQETYLYANRDSCSLYLDIWRPAAGAVGAGGIGSFAVKPICMVVVESSPSSRLNSS